MASSRSRESLLQQSVNIHETNTIWNLTLIHNRSTTNLHYAPPSKMLNFHELKYLTLLDLNNFDCDLLVYKWVLEHIAAHYNKESKNPFISE